MQKNLLNEIEKTIIPPNSLKDRILIYNQTNHLNMNDFSKKVNIPYRSLTRLASENLLSQNPDYYIKLENVLNCNYIDLYFTNSKQLFNYEIKVFKLISDLVNHVKYEVDTLYMSKHDFFTYIYQKYSSMLNLIFDFLECCWNDLRVNAVSPKLNSINIKLQTLIEYSKIDKNGIKLYRTDLLSDYFSYIINCQIEWFINNHTNYTFLSEDACYLRNKKYLYGKEFFINSTPSLISVFGQLVIKDITFWFNQFLNKFEKLEGF